MSDYTTILAIDPGPEQSGWVRFDCDVWRVIESGVEQNTALLQVITLARQHAHASMLAIEWITSYGMAVGASVFETCRWVGLFQSRWGDIDAVQLVPRREVKLHLCNSARAKDANVRRALLDQVGEQGTKRAPGPTYGVHSHAWAALAVAVTAAQRAAGEQR